MRKASQPRSRPRVRSPCSPPHHPPLLPMNTRRLLSVVPLAAMLATAPLSLFAQHGRSTEDQVGFVEKFALAKDREAVLSQLIPGSEEFYFYHALHFQNTRQKEKL